MNRQQKAEAISSLQTAMSGSQASFLVEYQGLTVAELMDLRKSLRPLGGRFRVSKVTLMRRAIQAFSDKIDGDYSLHFKHQVGLVFANGEPTAVAKVLKEFAQEHPKFKLQAGLLDMQVLDKGSVEALASLPSREILLGRMCGTLMAPAGNLVRVLAMSIGSLVCALKAIENQKAASQQ